MYDRSLRLAIATWTVLALGLFVFAFPLLLALVIASQSAEVVASGRLSVLPGPHFLENLRVVWETGDFRRLYLNSVIVALGTVLGKTVLATTTAFAVVFYRFPFRRLVFWLVFASLMLPLEVRIVSSYEVVANVAAPLQGLCRALGLIAPGEALRVSLLDTYSGLILPGIATATGTFLFRQFFLTLPDDLVDAAKMDGAGGLRFLVDIALPLSVTTTAALTTIMFVASWNSFLWPLLIIGDPEMRPAILGLSQFLRGDGEAARWHLTMAAALLVMLPPMAVVAALQRSFVAGLAGVAR